MKWLFQLNGAFLDAENFCRILPTRTFGCPEDLSSLLIVLRDVLSQAVGDQMNLDNVCRRDCCLELWVTVSMLENTIDCSAGAEAESQLRAVNRTNLSSANCLLGKPVFVGFKCIQDNDEHKEKGMYLCHWRTSPSSMDTKSPHKKAIFAKERFPSDISYWIIVGTLKTMAQGIHPMF